MDRNTLGALVNPASEGKVVDPEVEAVPEVTEVVNDPNRGF
jgi:hypothetical protein